MPVTINGGGPIETPSLKVNSVPVLAGPAFRAYRSTNVSLSSNVITKIALNAEDFDTANRFDSATNYRFTPNVAGFYQLNGNVGVLNTGGALIQVYAAIYKNGSPHLIGNTLGFSPSSVTGWYASVNDVVYLNGSTDYVELYTYAFFTTGTVAYVGGSGSTTFSGVLVRAE